MDVTPAIPADRQVIDSYGDGGFHISGVAYTGSVIVFPAAVQDWPVARFADVDDAALEPLVAADEVEILLLGCGARLELVPRELRATLRAAGIALEAMDTGAACRTYNVLLSEERRVAAALIAVT